MSPESEERNSHSQQQNPDTPRQEIIASEGATIKDVVQAIISGQVQGDVVFGDKIIYRSEAEELNGFAPNGPGGVRRKWLDCDD